MSNIYVSPGFAAAGLRTAFAASFLQGNLCECARAAARAEAFAIPREGLKTGRCLRRHRRSSA
jgi:hypothetical protein